MTRFRRRSGRARLSTTTVRTFALLVVIAGVLAIPVPAGACSVTAPFPELADYADEIAVAFVGREIDRFAHPSDGETAVFEVDRVYKGQAGPLIEVRTGYGYSNCTYHFGFSGTQGITARRGGTEWGAEEGDLVIGAFFSTASVAELEEVFGAGYPPDETLIPEEVDARETLLIAGEVDSEPPGRLPTWQTPAISIALIVLLADLIARHRRRRRDGR